MYATGRVARVPVSGTTRMYRVKSNVGACAGFGVQVPCCGGDEAIRVEIGIDHYQVGGKVRSVASARGISGQFPKLRGQWMVGAAGEPEMPEVPVGFEMYVKLDLQISDRRAFGSRSYSDIVSYRRTTFCWHLGSLVRGGYFSLPQSDRDIVLDFVAQAPPRHGRLEARCA